MKSKFFGLFLGAVLMCGAMALSVAAQNTTTTGSAMSSSSQAMMGDTIVDKAMAAPQFSTLVMLLQKADLVDTLKGAGPFTVFAPTNDAFAKIPKAKLDALMNDPMMLKQVLMYHVLNMKVASADAKTMNAPTAAGSDVMVKVKMSKGKMSSVMVNKAKVVQPDIMASNGVIHGIDTVLMPKMDMSKDKMMKDKKMGKSSM
jgi:uncharacterized surface protein with fasciclin (FAS1) repeats